MIEEKFTDENMLAVFRKLCELYEKGKITTEQFSDCIRNLERINIYFE